MYMRFVNVRYKPGELSKIRDVYDTTIIPRLEKVEGCLCVCAIVSDKDPEEGISLTLWETPGHARAYEKSGVYTELLEKVKPYLIDTIEWRVQLSKEMTVEYQPVEKEPVIQTFTTAAQLDSNLPAHDKSDLMYLRIVSVQLQPGKSNEFKVIYENDILPALKKLKGCRFAFMTKSSEDENRVVSISLWDSKQDADAYEKSGLFKELREKTKHTYSDFYRWKMALEREYGGRVMTSEDMKLDTYQVVIGKSF